MIADTTKSSANLEIIGVREMGRKCLLMTSTGFCLGMGTTSASFQDGGSCYSAELQLRMKVTGWAIKSAYSLNTHLGIPSGPAALQGFNFLIAVKTSTSEMVTTTEFALKGGIALSGKKDFIWSRKAELMAFATSQSGRWWSSPSTWSSECRLSEPDPVNSISKVTEAG